MGSINWNEVYGGNGGGSPSPSTSVAQSEEDKKKKKKAAPTSTIDWGEVYKGRVAEEAQAARMPKPTPNEPSTSVSKNFWNLDNFLNSIVEAGSLTVDAVKEQVHQAKPLIEKLGGGGKDTSLIVDYKNKQLAEQGKPTFKSTEDYDINKEYEQSGINAKRIEQGKAPIKSWEDANAETSILGEAINSPTGRKVVGRIARETSNMGVRGLARVESIGSKTYEQALNDWMEARQNPENPMWKKTLYAIQDSAPQALIGMLLTVGTTLLTRGQDRGYAGLALSSAYYGALSANEQLQERGRYESPGNVAIDVFGDQVINASLGKLLEAPAASILKEGIKGFGIEGGTEVAQTLAKYANDYQSAKSDEERAKVMEQASNYVKNGGIAIEFLAGGVAGATGSVATGAYSNVTNSGNTVSSMTEESVSPTVEGGSNIPEEPGGTRSTSKREPIETASPTENPVTATTTETPTKQTPTQTKKTAATTETPTNTSTASKVNPETIPAIRDSLDELSSELDTTDGAERQAVVDRINELLPVLNQFQQNNAEDIILVPKNGSQKAIPQAEAQIVEYPDGRFGARVGYSFSDRGSSSPFGTATFAEKPAAIRYVLDMLEHRVREEMARSDFKKTDVAAANRILAAIAQARTTQKVETTSKKQEAPQTSTQTAKKKSTTTESEDGVLADATSGSRDKAGSNIIDHFDKVEGESKPIPEDTGEFKLFEKVQGFIQKYGERFGEGNQRRNTAGWYSPHTHNIYINGRSNISTAAHEVFHHIDTTLKLRERIIESGDKSLINGIETMYMEHYGAPQASASRKLKVAEGLATLFQKYAETPKTIEARFPDLVDSVLMPGGQFYDPVFSNMITDLRSIVSEYQGLKALDKIGALVQDSVSKYNEKDISSWYGAESKVRAEVFDKIYPAEKIDQKLGLDGSADSVHLNMRAGQTWHAVAAQNIMGERGYYQWDVETGDFKKNLDFNWKTLVGRLTERSEAHEFGYFLVARRKFYEFRQLSDVKKAIDVTKSMLNEELDVDLRVEIQGKLNALLEEKEKLETIIHNDGIDKTVAEEAFRENAERFRDATEMYDKLTREDVKMMYQARLIDKATHDEYMANTGYASFRREKFNEIVGADSDLADQSIKIGGTKISATLPRKGSRLAIINPLHNGITNHMEITRKSMQRVVYNKIHDNWVDSMPDLFQKIPLKAEMGANGKITFPQEKNPNIIIARNAKGKRVAIETDVHIKELVDSITTIPSFNLAQRFMIGMSRMFTKGTTALYPAFAIQNFMIDQVSAFVNTQNNYIPVYDGLKEIGKVMMKRGGVEADYWAEYMILGGERMTFAGWQDNTPEQTLKRISGERGKLMKAVDFVDDWVLGTVAKPSQYSEIFSRYTEYAKARENGKPAIVAIEEAGRVTAPFHHQGKLGKGDFGMFWIRTLPFANAGLQVFEQLARTAGTRKGKVRMAVAVSLLLAAKLAELGLMMNASDDQKELYRGLDPEMLTRYVFIPSSNGKDLKRLRVPESFAFIGAMMNMAITDHVMSQGVDYSKTDFLRAATSWVPDQINVTLLATDFNQFWYSYVPEVARPLAEVAFDKKTFPKFSPLESQSLQNLPVQDRYYDSTSPFAKWLSKQIGGAKGLSPVKLDHLITGYFGRASGMVTGKTATLNPLSGMEQKYYFQSGKMWEEFYDVKKRTQQETSAFNKDIKDLTDEERNQLDETKEHVQRVDKYLKLYKEVDENADPQSAIELRDEIISEVHQTLESWQPK